jgi:SAM-dependent methyltransferase
MSRRTAVRADDPYGGREPTSHERHADQPWDASYLHGQAPWDIGAPQRAVVRLVDERAFAGAVLDAGCGTGENAFHIPAAGLWLAKIKRPVLSQADAVERASNGSSLVTPPGRALTAELKFGHASLAASPVSWL